MKHNLTIKSDIDYSEFFSITNHGQPFHVDYGAYVSTDYSPVLAEIIANEMISQGLDPINKVDVIEFWRHKGIGV